MKSVLLLGQVKLCFTQEILTLEHNQGIYLDRHKIPYFDISKYIVWVGSTQNQQSTYLFGVEPILNELFHETI